MTQTTEEDEREIALVCLQAVAIVAIVAGAEGEKAYPELIRLLGQIK